MSGEAIQSSVFMCAAGCNSGSPFLGTRLLLTARCSRVCFAHMSAMLCMLNAATVVKKLGKRVRESKLEVLED